MELLLPARTKIKFDVQISAEDTIKIFYTFGEEMCIVQMYTSCKRHIKTHSDSYINSHHHKFFLWCFEPIPCHCLQLRGFAITPIWHQPSVGILWTSNQPDAETSTWQQKHSQERDFHASGGIRTHNPSKPAATVPRGHWDQQHIW
jgi:hypothetical protein